MKNGTMYAGRLRKVYAKVRQSAPKPEIPELDEPLRRLAIATLGVETTDEDAKRAIDRAFATMVDWNEIRVSSAAELNRATGNAIPHGVHHCQRLVDALQAIYDRENQLSLDRLRSMGRRDARHYLEQLDGLDEYGVASVLLWSLGGHAIPVNDRLLAALRDADLVNPSAGRSEVQAFLERHVGAADAKEFCLVMQTFSPKKVPSKTVTKKKAKARKKAPSKSS